jgi:hypothetical protein
MSSKPLPSIPSALILPKLSVEGNALISSLVRQTIHEEDLDDSWIESILLAISTFGDYITSPQILRGLKTARVLHQTRKLSAELKQGLKDQERLKEFRGSRGKAPEKPRDVDGSSTPGTDAMKLKEIHDLVSNRPVELPWDCPCHLVLTVRDMDGVTQKFDGDAAIPTQSCIFVQDEFSLSFRVADGDIQQDDGGILVGLEHWSCKFLLFLFVSLPVGS